MRKIREKNNVLGKAIKQFSKSTPTTKIMLLTTFLLVASVIEGGIKDYRINKHGVSFLRMTESQYQTIKTLTDTLTIGGTATFTMESGDKVKISRSPIPLVGGIQKFDKNNIEIDITAKDIAPLLEEATNNTHIVNK